MQADEVKQIVEDCLQGCQVQVQGEGASFHLLVVCSQFEGLSMVKKQQIVYQCLNDQIASGEIHAVSMKTYTPEEWEKVRALNG